MRALLIHPDRDFELRDKLPSQEQALVQDLQLEPLLDAMAGGDELVLRVSREVLLSSLRGDVETIHYRQEILTDCLASPGVVKAIYDLSWEATEAKKEAWHWGGGILSNYPASNLSGSVRLLEALSGILRKLRRIAEENAERFQSRGFSRLFTTLRDELNDDYLHELHEHLSRLRFGSGIPVSAWLGESNEGKDYVLHFRPERRWEWVRRLLGTGTPVFTVRIPDRDEAGARALSDLRDRGLKLVAKAVSQSADHVVGFFEMLRTELAFYVGCLTLHARMANLGIPAAFPKPMPPGERTLRGSGLCDLSLGIGMGKNPIPNELAADGRSICIITGANQGGKTSFLRGVGLAQLMMQAGLFVAASSYVAEVCTGILTHFRREEDVSMKSGKLDEELGRMSAIVDVLSRDALVLFNESFAATNEREGSEIAQQVVNALLEKRVKLLFVTHLYGFAHRLVQEQASECLFLRAERRENGERTFKLVEGEPLDTSYGEDVYRDVFAAEGKSRNSGDAAQTASVNDVPVAAAAPVR